MAKVLTHNDYTVGWVCTLPKEQTAATAMLDQEHADLPKPPNDHNTYTLGRVGKHNVVIACLPKGEVGSNSSATVAIRMTSTFPSIKFGLMVGIGGGVPPEVRLGDVVVGTPAGGYSGVVQWDLGKTEQSDTFRRTGALNNSPSALRTALTKLDTKHEMKGSMIPQYLEDLKRIWPRLAAKYTRSESLEDVLFEADYSHVDDRTMGGEGNSGSVGEGKTKYDIGDVGVKDKEKEAEEKNIVGSEKANVNSKNTAKKRTLEQMNGSFIEEPDALRRKRMMVEDSTAKYPDSNEDKCCPFCDRTKTVKRPPRDMRVHYGLIASGNQVVKDAAFRDKINKRLGGSVFCFEMEAAGLMNDFPCIVIRGICDYADSHKNKSWQEHAAAVAAAFVKELLSVVPVHEVDQLPSVKSNNPPAVAAFITLLKVKSVIMRCILGGDPNNLDFMGILGGFLTDISNNITKASTDLTYLKHASISAEHERVLNWLSDIDSSSNYNKARERRTPMTGGWLLRGQSYAEWIGGEAPMLWLYGIPGCGKTVICSTIIESLWKDYARDLKANIAYFYFDFTEVRKQNVEECLRSILRQLSAKKLPAVVEALYMQAQERNTSPDSDALMDALKTVLQHAPLTFLVFDALDECNEVKNLMEKIAMIKRWRLPGVRILTTSRRERDIIETMDILSPHSICLETALVDEDIKTFVKQRLERDGPLKRRWSSNVGAKQEIEDALAAGSNGMFRWAVCQLDALENCFNLPMLRKALASLPKNLGETYERIISKIYKDHGQMALKILQWLTYSARPLRINEVVEVLAVDVEDDPRFDPGRRFPEPRDILMICSSLVTTSAETTEGSHSEIAEMEVRLAHFSVKEYLMSEPIPDGLSRGYSFREIPANVSIAEVCLAYLLHFDKPNSLTINTSKEFPLARYAAKYWTQHARVAGRDAGTVHQLVMELFLSKRDAYVNWIWLFDPEELWEGLKSTRIAFSPLYYASLAGLVEPTRLLLEKGADVNAQGGVFSNALQAASARGHDEIVQQLLRKGANINVPRGRWHGSALQAASAGGHYQIVQQLLEKGADVNMQGGEYGNALQAASARGHSRIVQQLLEKGPDINVQGGVFGNALQAASARGHFQIVQQLLEKGANVNVQGGRYGSALQAASTRGYSQIVQQLLEKGADVNVQGGAYGNALQAASAGGHSHIVQQLLEKGSDVNARGGEYGNALQAASAGGHSQIVQQLLEKGANINTPGGQWHDSALQAASARGHYQIVKQLLEKGANVNSPEDKWHGSALRLAIGQGHDRIVQLLLEKGANVNPPEDRWHDTALRLAIERGHDQIVQPLLENRASEHELEIENGDNGRTKTR